MATNGKASKQNTCVLYLTQKRENGTGEIGKSKCTVSDIYNNVETNTYASWLYIKKTCNFETLHDQVWKSVTILFIGYLLVAYEVCLIIHIFVQVYLHIYFMEHHMINVIQNLRRNGG